MRQSEQINELATALSKCQGELTPAQKNSKNPFFKSSYADLTDCLACCKEPLSKNGLAVIQTMEYLENGQTIIHTTLTHSSGQWIRSTMPIVCGKPNDAQSVGSSITYMRRYALCAIVGISAGDDDDGNAAKAPPVNQFKMSPDMIRELNLIIDECEPEFGERIMKTLHELNPPIRSFGELTIELYERIKAAAIKERDKKREQNNAAN